MSKKPTPTEQAFPSTSYQDWCQAVEKTLNGKNVDTLVTHDVGGLERQPLYTKETSAANASASGWPGFAPFIRGTQPVNDRHLPWHIVARVEPNRNGAAQEDILGDLNGGVSALLLDFTQSGTPNKAQIEKLLKGVRIDMTPLILRPGIEAKGAIEVFFNLLEKQLEKQSKNTITALLDYDPIGLAASFNQPVDLAALKTILKTMLKKAAPNSNINLLTASGMPYHNSGADPAAELAYAMATLVAYVKMLGDGGLTPAKALAKITLTLGADTDFFACIAKMRAARALWTQICQAYNVEGLAPQLHAEGSKRHYSVADPWINILRATIATLGAGLGGANFISVMPCTAASTGDNQLTRRVARNTQIILQEESHIGRVSDPAGGSWYIESLSCNMAQRAWALFQKIEAAGGIEKALTSGMIGDHIESLRAQTNNEVAHRRDPILGVTEFPNLGEAPLEPRAFIGEGLLGEHRPAFVFEQLRLAALSVNPKIYLATLGTQAQFTARANFAANLFAVGGIDAIVGSGGNEVKNITTEFIDSGAKIAVICGTDEAYENHADELATALQGAGVSHLWLAGKKEFRHTKFEHGDRLFAGCNILAILTKAHQKLGLGE